MSEQFLNNRIELHCGDCRDVLARLPADSIDSVVTDPPYSLVSITKRFGKEGSAPIKVSEFYQENGESKGSSPYLRASAGFMGSTWDTGEVAFDPAFWAEVYRVLKPGAHVLAMGGTRTYHRLACAIEDAGFEIRDCIMWVYGTGFPKSHDVSKEIDKAAGAERIEVLRTEKNFGITTLQGGKVGYGDYAGEWNVTAPATDAARQWQGWGTALKPAVEPIVLARKPLAEKTVASNVLAHGTGALNIEACRVGTTKDAPASPKKVAPSTHTVSLPGGQMTDDGFNPNIGRWPANLVHDGSAEVVAAFPESQSTHARTPSPTHHTGSVTTFQRGSETSPYSDAGSSARFFYTAKADLDDRLGSRHPTVKPLDLMQYLCRLITPPNGTVLDPFAGTGTTGEAAWREGFRAVLIEREQAYCADIRRRMALVLAGPDERSRETVKARNQVQGLEDLPLFRGG